jgi:hypothetical protein
MGIATDDTRQEEEKQPHSDQQALARREKLRAYNRAYYLVHRQENERKTGSTISATGSGFVPSTGSPITSIGKQRTCGTRRIMQPIGQQYGCGSAGTTSERKRRNYRCYKSDYKHNTT